MTAITAARDLREELRILPHAVGYEMRKATAFRLGFLLRELLRGLPRPIVTAFVYLAMLEASGATSFNGYGFEDLVGYLVWSSALGKCLLDEKTLDVAEQIFDGYVTKYLVLPVSFFTLVTGRFIQFTLLQLGTALVFWVVGKLLLPSLWPEPVSWVAALQALVLLLGGAVCFFLITLILNLLAFWLDVVWSLLGMLRFVTSFVSGALVPIALMPEGVQRAFAFTFSYWTVFAPAELLLGRQGTPEFVEGLLVLAVSVVVLLWLTHLTWKRGLRRYAGVGA